MEYARIAGKPATLDTAVAEAAKLLGASRRPLIAGLGTDVAGARAAIALARQIGAIIDHMNSDAVLRDLDVMRSSGVMLTTLCEAHVRADTLLLVGPIPAEASPELWQQLLATLERSGDVASERCVYWLCPAQDPAPPQGRGHWTIGKDPKDLPLLLAALRARIAGRPITQTSVAANTLDEIAAKLKAAHFGVAIWSAAVVDALAIEMLCGLVNDLNAITRFCGLPLAAPDNAIGVLQACAWMTGSPMRTGFGRPYPQHDPWLFNSRRIVDSGEADCVVWISAYRSAAPQWPNPPPTIALTGHSARFSAPPSVHIGVGHPGVDHAAVEHLALTGTLTSVDATQPSDSISVADAITRIAAALPKVRSC